MRVCICAMIPRDKKYLRFLAKVARIEFIRVTRNAKYSEVR